MKKKYIFAILGLVVIIIAAIILFLIFGTKKPIKERTDLPPVVTIPKNPYEMTPDQELVKQYRNSDAEDFEYNFKEKYHSRVEVLQEYADFWACLSAFKDHHFNNLVPDDVINQKVQDASHLIDKMNALLKEFPPSEDEIYHKKLNKFYNFTAGFVGDYRMTLEFDKEADQESLERLRKTYEIMAKAQEDFEAGTITLDQALDRIGLTLDEEGKVVSFNPKI